MQRILVNAPLEAFAVRILEDAGLEVVVVPEEDPEASHREAPSCAGMVANASLLIDGAFLDRAPGMRVVGRMGVGYDNVDVEAATQRGVKVVNTPLPVVEPVAEHTFALVLALLRRIVPGDRALREGRFREDTNLPDVELAGKTMGLIGLGSTGRRVAEIASAGFRMRVLYFDLVARPDIEDRLGARRASLEELLETSDFVSLHVSLSAATRGLIDAAALARMKPSAYLINLARGPVVDEPALAEALAAGRIAGAGLDVFETEPPGRENPLLALPNVVLSPHRGGFSKESLDGCSRVVEDILRVLRGEEPRFPVN